MEEYPDHCLRGLTKSDVISENTINHNAFYPDERTATTREDGGMEKSINWEDDQTVEALTLRDYPKGFARVSREGIHMVNALPGACGCISYERSRKQNNKYHGNIVFKGGLTKPHMRAIAASLVLACVKVHTS